MGKEIFRLFSGISLLALIASIVLMPGCSQDVNTIWSAKALSPDGGWVATVRTEQHGGPGTDGIDTNVYLAAARNPRSEELVLVFTDLYPDKNGGGLVMKWLDQAHLEVSLNRHAEIIFQVVRYAGIEISVREMPAIAASP